MHLLPSLNNSSRNINCVANFYDELKEVGSKTFSLTLNLVERVVSEHDQFSILKNTSVQYILCSSHRRKDGVYSNNTLLLFSPLLSFKPILQVGIYLYNLIFNIVLSYLSTSLNSLLSQSTHSCLPSPELQVSLLQISTSTLVLLSIVQAPLSTFLHRQIDSTR